MNHKITKALLSIVFISLAQAVYSQCACCAPKTMSTDRVANHTSSPLGIEQFQQILKPYLDVQKALAGDDLAATKAAGTELARAIGNDYKMLVEAARMIADAPDLSTARQAFLPISEIMLATAENIDLPDDAGLYKAYCPMAFNNKGGAWIQSEAVLANPYYGAMMLRCGSIKPLE